MTKKPDETLDGRERLRRLGEAHLRETRELQDEGRRRVIPALNEIGNTVEALDFAFNVHIRQRGVSCGAGTQQKSPVGHGIAPQSSPVEKCPAFAA